MQSMLTAATTMSQVQQQLDTISNNIANIDTTGFKKKLANFNELLVQQYNNQLNPAAEIGRNTPSGIRYGVGGKIGDVSTIFLQGTIQQTGRAMDFAFMNPDQFLSVSVIQNGQPIQGYTKDGSLQLSPVQGNPNLVQVTTSDGYTVNGANGQPIVLPANGGKVSITGDGAVTVYGQGGNVIQRIPLGIVQVTKPQILESMGSNVYRVSPGNGANLATDIVPLNNAQVQTGALEGSNVQLEDEMTNLIVSQRHYQAIARTLTTGDQMYGLINNLRQ